MNAKKSKVMDFDRRKAEEMDFGTQYKVRVPLVRKCEVLLGGERMEEIRV